MVDLKKEYKNKLNNNDELKNIHYKAISDFDQIQSSIRDERIQCLEDRRFYSIAGAQWEGDLSEQFANKPKFELNKIHIAIMRIISEYRNNKITVDYIPSDDTAEASDLADICDNLYRECEQDSSAHEAYDNAFEEGIAGGFGAWRLTTEYIDDEDSDDDRQRIKIEPIFDADSCVFFDLNAKRQDKADAKFCFVLTAMSKDSYFSEYYEDVDSFNKDITNSQFDWCSGDTVYIAEYYIVESVEDTIYTWEAADGSEEKYRKSQFIEDIGLREKLLAIGSKEIRSKKIKKNKIHKYIMSGSRIIEDCGYIVGNCIPIVPFFAKRWYIDNIERCMGHVRLAKGAQRLKNMQLSKLGEISALSSIEKPIFIPEQVVGHQMMWSQDNIKNYPYLLVNQYTDSNGQTSAIGPLAYTRSPQIPQAMSALLSISDQDMKEILGNHQAGEEIRSNISGKAIEMIQNKIDMQAYIYLSNMAKAIKRSGEIWIGMARDVYGSDRQNLIGIDNEGNRKFLEIMKPTINESGEIFYKYDISKAKFNVNVDVGPTSSSKRSAIVRSLISMASISNDPETQQVLSSMIMMNMEGEGINDVREYFRNKLLRLGVLKPTDEEKNILMQEYRSQQERIDPNVIYLQAAADEANARATKARADTMLATAKAEETKAKTIETISNIDDKSKNTFFKNLEKVSGMLKKNSQKIPDTITSQPQAQQSEEINE